MLAGGDNFRFASRDFDRDISSILRPGRMSLIKVIDPACAVENLELRSVRANKLNVHGHFVSRPGLAG